MNNIILWVSKGSIGNINKSVVYFNSILSSYFKSILSSYFKSILGYKIALVILFSIIKKNLIFKINNSFFFNRLKMNNFYTPALLISDYYDSLVREIDIYTEELMIEYNEIDILPPEPERIFVHKLIMINKDTRLEYVDDKYPAGYKYELKKNLEVIPRSTRVHEYLNMVRENAIAVIRKSEQDSFKKYNENRDKFKMIKGNISEKQIEMLKEELFSGNFCFLIRIDYLPNYNKNVFSNRQTLFSKSLFRLYTIKTDFYLRESDIHFIRFVLTLIKMLRNVF
jgi:hypothetical protein